MTALEVQMWISRCGLPSIRQAALAMGIHRNTMTKYAREGCDNRVMLLAMRGLESEIREAAALKKARRRGKAA